MDCTLGERLVRIGKEIHEVMTVAVANTEYAVVKHLQEASMSLAEAAGHYGIPNFIERIRDSRGGWET